jgi:PIN domain nuclease of toxin-antitoxin system
VRADARERIASPTAWVAVSAASTWELAIKHALGRLELPPEFGDAIREARFTELPVTIEHGLVAARLPSYHGDPFDRMLVAQAQLEGLTIVTRDAAFAPYGVPVLAA